MMIYFISSGCLRAGSCRRTGITQWTAQETKPTSRAATWDDRCWPTTHVATASPWWWAACQAEPLLQPPYLATGKPSDMRWGSDLFVYTVQFQVFRLSLEVEFVLTKKNGAEKSPKIQRHTSGLCIERKWTDGWMLLALQVCFSLSVTDWVWLVYLLFFHCVGSFPTHWLFMVIQLN